MPDYATGPGRHTHGRGAVIEAYVDTDALDHPCPHCDAKPGEFCRHDNGQERKVPCPKRITAAARASTEGEP